MADRKHQTVRTPASKQPHLKQRQMRNQQAALRSRHSQAPKGK
ncbi:MAG: hypothetical protein R3B90_23710 [Planctomycetaceae bacterium]